MSEPPQRFDRVRGLRDVLTATGAGIYLATHVAGPVPAEAMAAVHESDELELRIGRVGPDRADDLDQREREARAVVAAVLKASPERIVLTHGAAEAARLCALEVLGGRRTTSRAQAPSPRVTASGPLVLVRGLDPVVAAALRDVADALGSEVVVRDTVPRRLPAGTALVAAAHVDGDGRLLDPALLAAAARKAGAASLLDVGSSVGALHVDVGQLATDIVIADSHRWLLGPEAVACVWLAPHLGEHLPEWLRLATAPFGRGTLLALARSVGWLLMYVELPWALDRTLALADLLYEGLGAIEGVELMADADAHGAIAAFRIAGWDAEVVAEELSRSVYAILEYDPEAELVRLSVGAWNREREIERLLDRVTEIAASTPETLPRRPSLTVLSGPLEPEDGA